MAHYASTKPVTLTTPFSLYLLPFVTAIASCDALTSRQGFSQLQGRRSSAEGVGSAVLLLKDKGIIHSICFGIKAPRICADLAGICGNVSATG